MRKLSVLSACIVLLFCFSFNSSAMASDEEDVLKVIENFGKAISTQDTQLMSSLWWHSPKASGYGPQATEAFLSEGWELNVNNLDAFFSYLKSSGLTYIATPHHLQVTMLGKDVALVTSYATSTLIIPKTNEQEVELDRGTHVLQKIGGKWLIVHSHVSALPTE